MWLWNGENVGSRVCIQAIDTAEKGRSTGLW